MWPNVMFNDSLEGLIQSLHQAIIAVLMCPSDFRHPETFHSLAAFKYWTRLKRKKQGSTMTEKSESTITTRKLVHPVGSSTSKNIVSCQSSGFKKSKQVDVEIKHFI